MGELQSTVVMGSVWKDFLRQVSNVPETEAEKDLVSEVLKIKNVLDHKMYDESDSDVCELLLLKLQGMNISVKILQKTDIGKTVNCFRKHASMGICEIASNLVRDWKLLVDDIVDKMDKEEDEKNILANKPPKRPIIRIKFKKVDISSEKETHVNAPVTPDQQLWNKKESVNVDEQVKGMLSSSCERSFKDDSGKETNGKSVITKQSSSLLKPIANEVRKSFRSERMPIKPYSEKQNNGNYMEQKAFTKKSASLSKTVKQIRPSFNTEKGKNAKVESFETTKRKLQERYMEAERMKKKRQIQVLELYQGVLPQQSGLTRPKCKSSKRRNVLRY